VYLPSKLQPQALCCPLTAYVNTVLLKYKCIYYIACRGYYATQQRWVLMAYNIWPAVSKTFAFCSFTEKQKICWSQQFLNIATMLLLLYNTCSGNILVCEGMKKLCRIYTYLHTFFSCWKIIAFSWLPSEVNSLFN
jgi:hypothetical protein